MPVMPDCPGVPLVIGGDNLPSPVGIGLTNMPNIGEGVVIGGDNLLSPVGIGLTNLPNIGEGAVAPLSPPPGSGITG